MLRTDLSVLLESKNFIFAANSGFNLEKNKGPTWNEEDALLYGENKSVKLVEMNEKRWG